MSISEKRFIVRVVTVTVALAKSGGQRLYGSRIGEIEVGRDFVIVKEKVKGLAALTGNDGSFNVRSNARRE